MKRLQASKLNVRIGQTTVCTDLDITLETGQTWGLLGRNGSGKSTLLLTLAGLHPASSGSIQLQDKPLQKLPRRNIARMLGLLFQDNNPEMPVDVLSTCLSGLHPHLPWWHWEGRAQAQMANAVLEQVGLDGLQQRMSNSLSGGERQRLAIAALLLQQPTIWLLDEPTNHLDLQHQIGMLNLLEKQAADRQGTTMMALHDVNLAAHYCTHLLLLMGDGECLQGPADELLNKDNLHRLYGHPLVQLQHEGRKIFIPQT